MSDYFTIKKLKSISFFATLLFFLAQPIHIHSMEEEDNDCVVVEMEYIGQKSPKHSTGDKAPLTLGKKLTQITTGGVHKAAKRLDKILDDATRKPHELPKPSWKERWLWGHKYYRGETIYPIINAPEKKKISTLLENPAIKGDTQNKKFLNSLTINALWKYTEEKRDRYKDSWSENLLLYGYFFTLISIPITFLIVTHIIFDQNSQQDSQYES